MCGGFTCSKNALIALNILYVVRQKQRYKNNNKWEKCKSSNNKHGRGTMNKRQQQQQRELLIKLADYCGP